MSDSNAQSSPQTGFGDDGTPVVQKDELAQAVFIFTVTFALFLYTFTFEEVDAILAQGIGPAVFPQAILLIMMFLSALLGFRAVKPTPESASKYKPMKPMPKIVYISVGALLLFVVGLNFIGALPSVILFCLGLSWLWGERRYGAMIIVFTVFTGAVYLLFDVALNTNLP